MKKKKICIITGSRADYGILSFFLKKIQHDKDFDLKLIVTATHLVPKYGNTFKEILKDNIKIFKKVKLPLKDDRAIDISKATASGIIKYTEELSKIKPDLVLVLGDRFESLAFSIASLYLNLPIAHLHGGESTLAAIDDAIRHSISKMANFHFVSHINYKKKLINMGENPKNIFIIGSLGVENIKKVNLFDRAQIEKRLNLKLSSNNFLLTFHPETIGKNKIHQNIHSFSRMILKKFKDAIIIVTSPNIDMGNSKIFNKIISISKKNKKNIIFKKSLGKKMYFSILKHCRIVIGNSSSGVIEVPSFNIPTINIGDRQSGRIKAKSVIDCKNDIKSFKFALNKSLSKSFLREIKFSKNPYYKKNCSKNLINILKRIKIKNETAKKFYEKQN